MIITILIVFLSTAIIVSPVFFGPELLVDEESTAVDLAVSIAQILSALFVIAGTVIAVWQYYLSSQNSIIRFDTDSIQKAIDLSKYYKDEILHPYSMLKMVFIKAGITTILAKEKEKMKAFDEKELHEIFSDEELQNFKKRFSSVEYVQAIIQINQLYNLGLAICDQFRGRTVAEMSEQDRKAIASAFNARFTTSVMNNIEHFAMYFTHGVADESVVYQAISPTYLEMCRYYYYNIAVCSVKSGTKLYRNLQALYVLWNEKRKQTEEREREFSFSKGKVVNKRK